MVVLFASMVPVGLGLTEVGARLAPFFSLADAARYLNPRLGANGQVVLEGPLSRASSLTFYLNRKFFVVSQPTAALERDAATRERYVDETLVLENWKQANPIYLIILANRVPHWQKLVTERVHIYHQVTTCGYYVVLSNEL